MEFKKEFLGRVANQAAKSASNDAVEQTAPAIIETAPAATEVVVEVVEEVPAIEPQPEPKVEPVKAEVPAKAAPQPQTQQQPARSHKAPEKGKKVLKDLKELPTNMSLSFVAWVVDIEFADLGQGQVKVTSMKAASSEAGRINIVSTPAIEQEIYNIMILEGKFPLVNVRKYNDHYVVSDLVTSVEKASQTKVLTFGSEAQIPQWIINGLQKNGIAITPENIKAALDTIIVGTNEKGVTVVLSKREVMNMTANTATAEIATSTNVPAASATVTATTALNTATATNAAATTNATNVMRK